MTWHVISIPELKRLVMCISSRAFERRIARRAATIGSRDINTHQWRGVDATPHEFVWAGRHTV